MKKTYTVKEVVKKTIDKDKLLLDLYKVLKKDV